MSNADVLKFCRDWREDHDISQREIAEAVPITRSQVGKWERGETTCNRILYTYIRLGCPLTYGHVLVYLKET